MSIFVVAVHAPSKMPPHPTEQCTRSMIHKGMETQTLEGHGFVDNPPNDDDDIPIIVTYFNPKK